MEKALDRAMRVFWQRGYEGASIADLTKAMRINRPSLYAAFGDKEDLFRRVLDRYDAVNLPYWKEALNESTARAFAERLLRGAAESQTCPDNPPGCLMVHGALTCGKESAGVRAELDNRRLAGQMKIRERLERAKREGDLPASADPAALTQYLIAILRGMATQAVVGATRKEVHQVVDVALQAWPS